ncbi:hypothetical protein AB0I93_04855 [Streptomyces sp. NPDC049967]|uniref:hypothetical protein n=1 Tax=Streptomyces sp. NPDC049967 TaxID=3155658 RepID=UPI003420A9A8
MVMQPVLEISAADDFTLWSVGEQESYGYLALNGELTPAEVGRAIRQIADCNDFEPEAEHGPCPTDPLGTFLHGLLSIDQVRKLVARAQQDVQDFLSLAGTWAEQHLSAQAAAVTAALARALDLAPAR